MKYLKNYLCKFRLTHLTEAKDYEGLLSSEVPLTHLYFGESAPASVVSRVSERCPRLLELVVGAFGPGTIDQTLINAARGCPRLRAIGLGDCELTYVLQFLFYYLFKSFNFRT